MKKPKRPPETSFKPRNPARHGYLEYDGRNSCYIDTFFTCFIMSNPKWFKQHICNGKLGDFETSDLTVAAQNIQTELHAIYRRLLTKTSTETYKCRSLRQLFHKFDKLYKPAYPTEWLGEQNDPNEVVELLNRVFTLPSTIQVRPPPALPFSGITVHAKKGETVKVSDYIPITKEWVEDIGRHRTIKYLSADYLLVSVLRNLDNTSKITSHVVPEFKLVLPENPNPLKLKSMILHNGSDPHSGHYTGIVYIKGGWYYYDDMKSSYKLLGKSAESIMKDEFLQNCVGFFYA